MVARDGASRRDGIAAVMVAERDVCPNATMINAIRDRCLSGLAAMVGRISAISMERPLIQIRIHGAGTPHPTSLRWTL